MLCPGGGRVRVGHRARPARAAGPATRCASSSTRSRTAKDARFPRARRNERRRSNATVNVAEARSSASSPPPAGSDTRAPPRNAGEISPRTAPDAPPSRDHIRVRQLTRHSGSPLTPTYCHDRRILKFPRRGSFFDVRPAQPCGGGSGVKTETCLPRIRGLSCDHDQGRVAKRKAGPQGPNGGVLRPGAAKWSTASAKSQSWLSARRVLWLSPD